jgi:signal transduction histidine kinase/ligand-binding sensor domain-containing protein/DNA-binding response OmpR family regulator
VKARITIFVFFCFFLLQTGVLYAQRALVFKNINVDNGLPQNTVLSVLQDRKGYIWAGTFDGLSKFNGLEFKVYKNETNNSKSISSNKINKLFEDADGKLWVGTIDGLNLFDPDAENFTRFKLSNLNTNRVVLSITQDKHGVLWVGTDKGLFCVSPPQNGTKSYTVSKSEICGDNKITYVYIDTDQNLWMGSGQRLEIYNIAKSTLLPLPASIKANKNLANSVIRDIVQDHSKNFWVATETHGLFYYNVKDGTCFNYTQDNGLLSNTVRAVLEKENNEIWVGTKKGLNIIDTRTNHIGKFINDPINANSLSQNSIRCFFKDNENNIWLGTYNGGLNSVYSQYDNFYYLGLKKGSSTGLSYVIVNALAQTHNGDFWMGTDDGGLNHVDSVLQHNHIYYQYNGANRELLGNSIKGIAETADSNKLWIATGSGLCIFDRRNGTFATTDVIPKPSTTGFIQDYVLLSDSNGLWIGTNFNGLYYLENKGKLHHYPTSQNNIIALFKDENDLWIGTKDYGLNRLNVKTGVVSLYKAALNNPYSLTSNAILAVYKGSHKRVWIGTDGGGLNYFDTETNRFFNITETLGISNNTVHGILEDGQGRLWISTNKGLSCISFNRFRVPFNETDLTIANYTIEDGLQSNQFTTGAAIKARNGNLLFAGINGITAFNPAKIKLNKVKPPIVFTDFLIFNKTLSFDTQGSPLKKPIDETHEITLSHNQTVFSIKFAALNYINPKKNQFAFKLDGFSDSDWHFVGNQQMATYTNLDPGTYFFKVKAANNDGIWNETPRVLKIIILPPWWKTYWAYAGYAIIIIFLLYLFNFYSKKTERLKNELKYESISHIKDQELAQKQLSFFVNISHEIKTPLTMIMAPLERMIEMNISNNKVQNQLMLMHRNGERLIRLINQLLDKKKLESGQMHLQASETNIVSFIQEILLAFDGLAKLKNIDLKLKTKQPDIKIWFDNDKLEKVLYNLLSNAIKFTQNYGNIIVSITNLDVDGDISITVEDNGCGIPAENIKKIFTQFYHYDNSLKIEGTGLGLAFSKELVELHHGELTVESRPETPDRNGFTRFSIKLSIGNKHLKETEISSNYKDSEDIQGYNQTKNLSAAFDLKKAEILENRKADAISMLIVEDNQDVLEFIKTGFEADFEVFTATNGLEGLSLAKKICPDIIISDVMMPGINGIELCGLLKSDILTSHIPVILLTARTQIKYKMEGLETGADDYITKPFNFSILEIRAWNLIENRQKLKERYQKEINLDPQNIAISNLDEAFLKKVLNYIELHIADPELSVELLSQEVAMSKSLFYKKIKSLTNLSGVEFIRSVRIKRAAQILAQGQSTVNEVAYMVGFSDVNYFRKCFKEQFNHTPKEHSLSGMAKT